MKNNVIRFRVNDEEKLDIIRQCYNNGFDNVSQYLLWLIRKDLNKGVEVNIEYKREFIIDKNTGKLILHTIDDDKYYNILNDGDKTIYNRINISR